VQTVLMVQMALRQQLQLERLRQELRDLLLL
jgi:hypothetical protein